MITIGEPKILKRHKKARLIVPVELDCVVKNLWLEVDDKYAKYLVKDRCDAFVVALLPLAMRSGKDMICLSPVSEELLHNIRTQLIPALVKTGSGYYKTRISAEINRHEVKNVGAVGTGLSRGIDSMHVLNNYWQPEYKDLALTHVCINDVGAFDVLGYSEGGRNAEEIKEECFKKSLALAKELDLPCVITRSNLTEDFNISYVLDHIYCNLFPVFALQKLYKRYYYGSSGYDYSAFSMLNSDKRDCAYFELLLDSVLSVSNLKIFPEGGEKNRLEKTEDIIHFAPAQKNLHVCITDSKNCNRCIKCMRTLLTLDALDSLDNFSQVFDVDYYRHNKRMFVNYLETCHSNNDKMNEPTYKLFKEKNMLPSSPPAALKDNIKLPEQIHSSSVLIKDLSTNKLLIKKQSSDFFAAVGFAKIMTAIIALESGETNLTVSVPPSIAGGLKSATIYDLVNILLISQNNEAAEIIAESLSGSVEEFVVRMNEKSKQIHAYDTNYATPSGVSAGSYTTADDACRLIEYAIQNEHFCRIFKSKSYTMNSGGEQHTVVTQNPLFLESSKFHIDNILGTKFGVLGVFSNLVAITKHNEHIYLAILLGVKEGKNTEFRYEDIKALLDCVIDAE